MDRITHWVLSGHCSAGWAEQPSAGPYTVWKKIWEQQRPELSDDDNF